MENGETCTQPQQTQEALVDDEPILFGKYNEDVWGRLIAQHVEFRNYELVQDSITFGRETGGYVFDKSNFDNNLLPKISKQHFRIYREKQNDCYVTFLEDLSSNGTFINQTLVGKTNANYLLHNDQISFAYPTPTVFAFHDSFNSEDKEYPLFVKQKYPIGRKLGTGTFGEVRLAYRNKEKDSVAIKILPKNALSSNGKTIRINYLRQIENEIQLLKSIDHPCIISMIDFMESDNKMFIVMEYAAGGDLFNKIKTRNRLDESITKIYFYQLFNAVNYLHRKNIAHRDIKPENILLETQSDLTRIKLSDFGLSKLLKESAMFTLCGTENYLAPEVLALEESKCYKIKVDMWSLGVVLYACLSGCLPFSGKTQVEIRRKIIDGEYTFGSKIWREISDNAKDLIKKLLVVNYDYRCSPDEALSDPWLTEGNARQIAEDLMKNSAPARPKRLLSVSGSSTPEHKLLRPSS